MKHYRIYRAVLMALIVTATAACSSELTGTEGTQPQPVEPGEQITVIATQQTENGQKDSPQTRVNYDFLDNGMVAVTWAKDDVFYVGNEGWMGQSNKLITDPASGFKSFKLNGEGGSKKGEFTGILPDNTGDVEYLYAIYGTANAHPEMITWGNDIEFPYTKQCQTANDNTAHLAGYDFMTATTIYKKGTTPEFKFNRLGAMMKFDLTLPEVSIVKELSLSAVLDNNSVFCSKTKWEEGKKLAYHTLSNYMTLKFGTDDNGISIDGTLTAYMMVAPTNLSIYPIDGEEILLTVKDQDNKLHIAILKGSKIEAGKCYTVTQKLAPAFADGSGIAADPYLISTAEQLRNLSRLVNTPPLCNSFKDKYYQLTTDIDLENKPWTPIGYNYSTTFNGHFSGKLTDGKAPTISGLSITQDTSDGYNGLFGYVSVGSISNITIGGSITVNYYIGSIAGNISGGTLIENCTSTCNITTTTNIGYAGGIVGIIEGNATLTNCTYTGTATTAEGKQPGGIVGYINLIGSNKKTVTLTGCSSTPTNTIIGLINPDGGSSSEIIIKKDADDTGVTLKGNSGDSYPQTPGATSPSLPGGTDIND